LHRLPASLAGTRGQTHAMHHCALDDAIDEAREGANDAAAELKK
jgi:hypothetical protein